MTSRRGTSGAPADANGRAVVSDGEAVRQRAGRRRPIEATRIELDDGPISGERGRAPPDLEVRWGYVWLGWAVVAVVFSSQNAVGAVASGIEVDWGWAVYHELVYWAVWATLTPFIVRVARRYRVASGAGRREWGAHLAVAIVLAPLHIAIAYLLHGLWLVLLGSLPADALGAWLEDRGPAFVVIAITGLWKYAAIVAVYYAFDYAARWRHDREEAARLALRASRLEARLSDTRLAALRSRLQPHFLFNTLNSIAVLAREAPERAEATVVGLSSLLRQTLEHEHTNTVPLSEEIDFLERYLEIQKVRYEERLDARLDIDPAALELPVPFLVLQPLVENAVRHSVDRDPAGAIVVVRVRVRKDRLLIEVEDTPATGSARDESSRSNGTGLATLRGRLEELYGDRCRFSAGPREDGGFAVHVELPLPAGAGG